MCFTETLLQENILHFMLLYPDFRQHWHKKTADSGKRKGRGNAVLVNSTLCYPRHVTVNDCICTADFELLPVSFHPNDGTHHLCYLLLLRVKSLAKLLPGYEHPECINRDPCNTFNFPTTCQLITHPCKDLLLHL